MKIQIQSMKTKKLKMISLLAQKLGQIGQIGQITQKWLISCVNVTILVLTSFKMQKSEGQIQGSKSIPGKRKKRSQSISKLQLERRKSI